jgi:hypothetical protein
MGRDRITEFIVGAISTTIVAYVVLSVFSSLLSSPVSLDPGDSLYQTQQSLAQSLASVLPLLVPGAAGAIVVVALILRDEF